MLSSCSAGDSAPWSGCRGLSQVLGCLWLSGPAWAAPQGDPCRAGAVKAGTGRSDSFAQGGSGHPAAHASGCLQDPVTAAGSVRAVLGPRLAKVALAGDCRSTTCCVGRLLSTCPAPFALAVLRARLAWVALEGTVDSPVGCCAARRTCLLPGSLCSAPVQEFLDLQVGVQPPLLLTLALASHRSVAGSLGKSRLCSCPRCRRVPGTVYRQQTRDTECGCLNSCCARQGQKVLQGTITSTLRTGPRLTPAGSRPGPRNALKRGCTSLLALAPRPALAALDSLAAPALLHAPLARLGRRLLCLGADLRARLPCRPAGLEGDWAGCKAAGQQGSHPQVNKATGLHLARQGRCKACLRPEHQKWAPRTQLPLRVCAPGGTSFSGPSGAGLTACACPCRAPRLMLESGFRLIWLLIAEKGPAWRRSDSLHLYRAPHTPHGPRAQL